MVIEEDNAYRTERTGFYKIELFEALPQYGDRAEVRMIAWSRRTGRQVFDEWVRRDSVDRLDAKELADIVRANRKHH